jgi:hypothetical protein
VLKCSSWSIKVFKLKCSSWSAQVEVLKCSSWSVEMFKLKCSSIQVEVLKCSILCWRVQVEVKCWNAEVKCWIEVFKLMFSSLQVQVLTFSSSSVWSVEVQLFEVLRFKCSSWCVQFEVFKYSNWSAEVFKLKCSSWCVQGFRSNLSTCYKTRLSPQIKFKSSGLYTHPWVRNCEHKVIFSQNVQKWGQIEVKIKFKYMLQN